MPDRNQLFEKWSGVLAELAKGPTGVGPHVPGDLSKRIAGQCAWCGKDSAAPFCCLQHETDWQLWIAGLEVKNVG